MTHDPFREDLGAYTMGALDPTERTRVDAHLGECPDCRDELAKLAALPGLLSRLSAEEAASSLVAAAGEPVERAIVVVAAQQRAARRRLRRWQLVAAAALGALALLVTVPLVGGAADVVLTPRPAAADAGLTEGTARVIDEAWGMTVELDLRHLPERTGYTLVAVTHDDQRRVAASWTGGDHRVALTGSCYVTLERLARLEVVTPDEEVVVVFDV